MNTPLRTGIFVHLGVLWTHCGEQEQTVHKSQCVLHFSRTPKLFSLQLLTVLSSFSSSDQIHPPINFQSLPFLIFFVFYLSFHPRTTPIPLKSHAHHSQTNYTCHYQSLHTCTKFDFCCVLEVRKHPPHLMNINCAPSNHQQQGKVDNLQLSFLVFMFFFLTFEFLDWNLDVCWLFFFLFLIKHIRARI